MSAAEAFDATVYARRACSRFQRFDGTKPSYDDYTPSQSNETVVNLAFESLDLARRAPTGFNTQPYKLVLVHSPDLKKKVSDYCAGANGFRVCDSDCTAVFLADREVVRTMGKFGRFLREANPKQAQQLRKIQTFVTVFSSGYPLPRFLAVPISFVFRVVLGVMKPILHRWIVLPTLSGAETWAIKNTMLVAMTYMLACTSRGLSTAPMEGFDASGIKRALNIPRRYSIPLIVATGTGAEKKAVSTTDDAASIKATTTNMTPRYPRYDEIFSNKFGTAIAAA